MSDTPFHRFPRFPPTGRQSQLLHSARYWEHGAGNAELRKTQTAFDRYSQFLFAVATKLSARGYNAHLAGLLLRLNFNGHFATRGSQWGGEGEEKREPQE